MQIIVVLHIGQVSCLNLIQELDKLLLVISKILLESLRQILDHVHHQARQAVATSHRLRKLKYVEFPLLSELERFFLRQDLLMNIVRLVEKIADLD